MEPTTIAVDLAKRVFQIHFVDPATGAIHSKVLKRAQLVPFFATRVLARLGHDVKLIAAQFVRPFVKSNKNDAADAAAIWEAAQRPGMRFVAVKTEDQQAMLALHRIRQQLVRIRVMQINQLRGLLYEFGAVLPQGRRPSIEAAKGALASLADQLPAMRRADRADRTAHSRMAPQRCSMQTDLGNSRCRRAHRDRGSVRDRTGEDVPLWAGVCRLSGSGATTERLRWQGEARQHQQTR